MKTMNHLLTFGLLTIAMAGMLAMPAPASAMNYCTVRLIDLNSPTGMGEGSFDKCYENVEACFVGEGCQASGAGCPKVCLCQDVGDVCPPPQGGSTVAGESRDQSVRRLVPRGMGDISLQTLSGRFINIMIGISGSVALLMFVYGGFMMLTSAGDSDRVGKGKKAMVWAVIGLVVIFGAYAILSALFTALGAGV